MNLMIRVFFILIIISCSSINYKPDTGFLNSAQANSLEYLVRVNGTICKDMDNNIGLCAKKLASDEKLNFSMDARGYAYRFNLRCTRAIDSDFSIDVERDQPLKFSIEPLRFHEVKSFTCIGEIFPHDRDQEISANWSLRVVVYDENYLPREIIYRRGDHIVFGQHARYVNLNGKRYKKKPVIKFKEKIYFAYSESERMRLNYYHE